MWAWLFAHGKELTEIPLLSSRLSTSRPSPSRNKTLSRTSRPELREATRRDPTGLRGRRRSMGRGVRPREGRRLAEAELASVIAAVIGVLKTRGLVLSADQRERVLSCRDRRDLAAAERWLRASMVVASADGVFRVASWTNKRGERRARPRPAVRSGAESLSRVASSRLHGLDPRPTCARPPLASSMARSPGRHRPSRTGQGHLLPRKKLPSSRPCSRASCGPASNVPSRAGVPK